MQNINKDEVLISQLFDAQPECVFWMKPFYSYNNGLKQLIDFELCYCNKAGAKLMNISQQEALGKLFKRDKILGGSSEELAFQQSLQVFEDGLPGEFIYFNPALHKNFHVTRTKINDGILNVARDISVEVAEKKQLTEQSEFLNTILDASINAVCVYEAVRNDKGQIIDLLIVKVNRSFTNIIEKSVNEAEGKLYLSLFPSAKELGLFDMHCKVIETGIALRKEIHYKDSELDAWYDLSLVRLSTGRLLVTFNDITAAKKTSTEVEMSAEKLRKFINNVQSGMSYLLPVKNETGEIVDFYFDVTNAAFAAYPGIDTETLAGDFVSKWFPSYFDNGLFERCKQTWFSGETARFEIHYKDENLDIWLDVLCTKMEEGVLVTTTDLTTVKKLQLKLEASVKELKKSNASLQEFAYVASHDLQEPLRKIQVFADRLKKDITSLSAENQNVFERMILATRRMSQLINDLLEYSQLSIKSSEFKTVDLTEIVHQVLGDLEAVIAEKEAEITLQNLPHIKGDAIQLRQLFQNLISNSLKYCNLNVKPIIRISSHLAERDVHGAERTYHRIEIADNGIGFDQQNAERIFKVFQRLHGRSEYPGTGIGLAIVFKVVENHKGYVTAESEPDQGAVFIVDLPA